MENYSSKDTATAARTLLKEGDDITSYSPLANWITQMYMPTDPANISAVAARTVFAKILIPKG